MRIKITHTVPKILDLPINYHHMLQSMIYGALDDEPVLGRYLHDRGASYGKRNYKLFTFSLLQGKYEIHDKRILFREQVSFKIGSSEPVVLRNIAEHIEKNGLDYGDTHISDVQITYQDDTIEEECVNIRMLSPLCVYSSDRENGHVVFYKPEDAEFSRLINDNFKRKYLACYGVEPETGVQIVPLKVSQRDKYVTRYKNFYISGWLGQYTLKGNRKYLDFLLQTGLGGKNSQGFGMFEKI